MVHSSRMEQKCQKISIKAMYKNVREWIGPGLKMSEVDTQKVWKWQKIFLKQNA